MNLNHEQDIDRVLNALGHTAPPTGLEARIASRLRTTAATRTARHSPFAVSTPFFAVILNAVKDPRISPLHWTRVPQVSLLSPGALTPHRLIAPLFGLAIG